MSMYEIILAKFALIMTKLAQVNASEQKVYDAGYEKGKSEGGYEQGVADGKKAEYDAFWGAFQDNGNRIDYQYTFRNWNDAAFKPKYDIRPTNALQMFQSCKIKDIAGAFKNSGSVLDLSNCTNIYMAFYWCQVTEHIPIVDTTGTPDKEDAANRTFYYLFGSDENLQSIEKIILKQSGSQGFNGTFSGCYNLEEVRFEGVIGQSGLSFQDSRKLSKASIGSIIDCLSDTTPDTAKSITLSLVAVNKAFETSEGANDGAESDEYLNRIATPRVNGWTISLV